MVAKVEAMAAETVVTDGAVEELSAPVVVELKLSAAGGGALM